MGMNRCRVCGSRFFQRPLLEYKNMPRVAQYLPDKSSLKKDRGITLKVWQCAGCGLVQLNSAPVFYYKEVRRAAGFSEEMMAFRERQFKDFVKRFSLKNKKIIEIGCGGGEYLSIMKKCGVRAYGLEYSKDLVANCVKRGLRVSRGFVSDTKYRIRTGPFDGFLMLSFLEHLPDPGSALRGICNNLKDGGVGLIEVPSFDMILRRNLFSEFMADHLFYFTAETLKNILELNGFEVVECKEIWREYIISAVVIKRGMADLSDFYRHQARIKSEIGEYIGRFRKVAIWGAGHQALAIISLAGLKRKIKYVIDSAPFKQGKFTPASHIPIVSPDALDSDPVDAVIVMAASYSDEVARIIQQKYGRDINIAILRDFGLEEV